MTIKKVDEQDSKEASTIEKKHIIKVVKELPLQPVRTFEDEEAVYTYITIEEYLTSQANKSA